MLLIITCAIRSKIFRPYHIILINIHFVIFFILFCKLNFVVRKTGLRHLLRLRYCDHENAVQIFIKFEYILSFTLLNPSFRTYHIIMSLLYLATSKIIKLNMFLKENQI